MEHGDRFILDGTLSWLLHLIHAKVTVKDGKHHIQLRLFGRIYYDSLRGIQKRKLRRKKKKLVTKVKSEVYEEVGKAPIKEKVLHETKEEINQEVIEEHTKEPIQLVDFTESTEIKRSFFEKVSLKIKEILTRVKLFFQKLYIRLKGLFDTLLNLNRIRKLIAGFLEDEINKDALKLTFASVVRIFKHILPTKVKSNVVFGTGDPCSTGQALGVLGVLYSLYGDHIKITPDFINKRFEGNHYIKGRIRLITLLIIGIKLILDRRFKHMTRKLKTIKEAL